MTTEIGNSQLSESAQHRKPAPWEFIVKPRVVSEQLAHDANLEPPAAQIVSKLFDSLKYRLTILNFLVQAVSVEPKEKVGIVFFVGLINNADDLLDSDTNLSQIKDTAQLKSKLLDHVMHVDGKNDITLSELLQLTLDQFPAAKQDLITGFLDEALAAQVRLQDFQPGTYTFEEALQYRINTSNRYSEVGAQLANITDTHRLEEAIVFGNIMQMIDDVADLYDDYNQEVMNPVVGLASETQELNVLHDVPAGAVPDNFILRVRFARKLFRKMPEARKRYKMLFTSELDKLSSGKQKVIATKLGRLML